MSFKNILISAATSLIMANVSYVSQMTCSKLLQEASFAELVKSSQVTTLSQLLEGKKMYFTYQTKDKNSVVTGEIKPDNIAMNHDRGLSGALIKQKNKIENFDFKITNVQRDLTNPTICSGSVAVHYFSNRGLNNLIKYPRGNAEADKEVYKRRYTITITKVIPSKTQTNLGGFIKK